MTERADTTLERATKDHEAVKAEFPDNPAAVLACLTVAGRVTMQANKVATQLSALFGNKLAEQLVLRALKLSVTNFEWACDEARKACKGEMS